MLRDLELERDSGIRIGAGLEDDTVNQLDSLEIMRFKSGVLMDVLDGVPNEEDKSESSQRGS